MHYRKKPVVIEANQYTGTNGQKLEDWSGGQVQESCEGDGGTKQVCTIRTLEGVMQADVGDFIIRGVKGEYYPCKPDIFEATYELVEE